jgi:histidyl-tRNA synthetase
MLQVPPRSRQEGVGELRMQPMQPARGTQDLLPEAARRHRRVRDAARAAAELYGFAEMATPIFEFTEVFARPIG